jgi:hypothetical protein
VATESNRLPAVALPRQRSGRFNSDSHRRAGCDDMLHPSEWWTAMPSIQCYSKKIPIWQWPKCHATFYEETAPTQGRVFKSALGAIKLTSSFVLRASKDNNVVLTRWVPGKSRRLRVRLERGRRHYCRRWTESVSRAAAACGRQASSRVFVFPPQATTTPLPLPGSHTSAMLQSLQSNGPQKSGLDPIWS